MPTARQLPRRDPLRLTQIHSDFAAGLAATEIAAKYALPVPAVLQIVANRQRQSRHPDPSLMPNGPFELHNATQIYWLGFIAASGRLFQRGPTPTLVLDVDPRDVGHIHTMVEDLCAGRPSCEFCQSSQNGLQAYIRDRDLGRLLPQWGLPQADPAEGSVAISLIPGLLFSHFVRGYLEGGHEAPPFAQKLAPASLASIRAVGFIGPEDFITTLSKTLRARLGIGAGKVTARRDRLRALAYRGRSAKQVIQFAYRDVTRSLPRAAKLVHSIHPV